MWHERMPTWHVSMRIRALLGAMPDYKYHNNISCILGTRGVITFLHWSLIIPACIVIEREMELAVRKATPLEKI